MDLENDHSVPVGTKGHGFSGFLDISVNGPGYLKNQSDAQTILKATAKKLGQDNSDVLALVQRDLNNNDADHDQQTGVFGFPAHRDPMGRRVHAGTAVLETLNATNADGSKKYPLTLSLQSLATKILFNTTGSAKPKAIGIEYLLGQSMYSADPRYNASNPGIKKQAFARKEVIISGGTFNTPQLLKLSGIGPKAELAKFNISVVVDLPGVGSNLQDNPELGAVATANVPALSNLGPLCTWGAPGDPCLEAWYRGQGQYAQGPLVAIMAKTSKATERDLFIFGIPSTSFRGYWPSEAINTVTSDPPSTWDFSIVKIHPQSLGKGTVTLNSADPRDTPEINFRFFEGPGADADIAAIAEGVELGRSIFDSIPAPLGPFTESFPCENGNRTSCDVKERILTQSWSHHASSSCPIGADSDPMAVLDSKFRVRGVTGLRVVDASAFPKVPGGFPVIPVFIISMKASETILQDAKAM
jgi:choline dehydrogenase-like flavoprotein